jgi:hypothetical protein
MVAAFVGRTVRHFHLVDESEKPALDSRTMKDSLIKGLGLPDQFGLVLLVAGLVLSMAPYLAGVDFGIFKIPLFESSIRTRLKIIGPVWLAIAVLLHVPLRTSGVQPDSKASVPTDAIFSDTFSATLGSRWQVVTGKWSVEDGVLDGQKAGGQYDNGVWAAITLNQDIPDNCIVSFRTRLVDAAFAELMLHMSLNRYVRAYLYEVDQAAILGNGRFLRKDAPGELSNKELLSKGVGGGASIAEHGYPISLNEWYSVTVTNVNNEFRIYVGGQLVVQYIDVMGDLNRSGGIGFLVNGHAQFDDLAVMRGGGR